MYLGTEKVVLQINAFVHLLIHETDVEKALVHIEQVVVYLVSGWNGLFQREWRRKFRQIPGETDETIKEPLL